MERDPLEYALNRMEAASRMSNPAEYGYGKDRKELLDGITALRAEVERLKGDLRIAARFILKDHEGKAVSQGAFNGLEAHYYEFLAVVSRIEKEGLVKALREGSQWKDGENTRESWTYESLATIAIAYLLAKEKP